MYEGEDKFNEEENYEPCISKYIEMMTNNESYFFDVDELEQIADFFMDEGKTKKALEALSFGIHQHPFSSSLWLRKAQIYVSTGRLKSAHDCLDRAQGIDGLNDELCITRASLYSQQHKHDKAIIYFKKALELTDDFKEDILIDLAFEYENAEQYANAIDCLKEVLEENPDNEAALYEMVYCFGQMDHMEEAVEFLNAFLEHHPYSFTAWYNLGNAYSGLDMHEKAIFAYEYCTVIDDSFSSAYFNAGNSYVALKKYQKAIEFYKKTLKYEPPQAITFNYIGECYEKLEQFGKAEIYFRKALEIDNDFSDAWIGLAIAKDNQNQEKEAIGLIEQAINLKPDFSEYWHIYAESLEKNQRIEEAEIAYLKALELNPAHAQLKLDYADYLANYASLSQATDYLFSIEEQYANYKIYYRLAALSLKNGRENDALNMLERALIDNKEELNRFTDYYPEALNYALVVALIEQYT